MDGWEIIRDPAGLVFCVIPAAFVGITLTDENSVAWSRRRRTLVAGEGRVVRSMRSPSMAAVPSERWGQPHPPDAGSHHVGRPALTLTVDIMELATLGLLGYGLLVLAIVADSVFPSCRRRQQSSPPAGATSNGTMSLPGVVASIAAAALAGDVIVHLLGRYAGQRWTHRLRHAARLERRRRPGPDRGRRRRPARPVRPARSDGRGVHDRCRGDAVAALPAGGGERRRGLGRGDDRARPHRLDLSRRTRS